MLGMGLTLQASDFKQILKQPKWVLVGIGLQFILMPSLGWGLGKVFDLPTFFAVGLILVSCCPGGTASNVIAYLAKANVALSVCMTTVSTLAAILLTPYLTSQLSGSYVNVDAAGLFYSTLKVVLLPILLGVILNRYLPKSTSKILPFAPPVAVLLITLIVASIIGQGKEIILNSGIQLILALLCLHSIGFLFGFLISLGLFKSWSVAKTISIEVGDAKFRIGCCSGSRKFFKSNCGYPSRNIKFDSLFIGKPFCESF